MSPQVIDKLMFLIAFAVPVILVLRFKRRGVVYGAITTWITLVICGKWLNVLDPKRNGGILDTIWLLFGWIPSVIYSLLLLVVIQRLLHHHKDEDNISS